MDRVIRPPDLASYHRSISIELHSLKNRIRDIVQDRHWQTDGEHKETALRSVLRRHLPQSVLVGRGFIVTPQRTSSQIDILVVDRAMPTLFRDGDLMIVTPDAARAIVEVKTELRQSGEITDALSKLTKTAGLCPRSVWVGLFAYEPSDRRNHKALLRGIGKAFEQTRVPVSCVSIGTDLFVRHWSRQEIAEIANLQELADRARGIWRSYELHQLASSYFISNLVYAVSPARPAASSFAWFPAEGGKEAHARFELEEGDTEPIEL